MTLLLVCPLKEFALAKQRLAGLFTASERAALARALASDALGQLTMVGVPLLVVCADAEARALATTLGAPVLLSGAQGQSGAVRAGVEAALNAGYRAAATVALDIPGLDPVEVRALLEAGEAPGVAAVADRHGRGTNALRLSPPDAISLHFGPDSLNRHREDAAARGCGFEVLTLPSLALDLDEPDDVAVFLSNPVAGCTLTLLEELDASERLRRRSSLAG